MKKKCSWKIVRPEDFRFGMPAERCGEIADIRIIRSDRAKDLFLCEEHTNDFIKIYGIDLPIQILCREQVDGPIY